MKYDFLEIKTKLNQKYHENIIEYCEGLDIIPSMPKLKGIGYTEIECDKLYKLYDIEHMKYILKTGIEEGELNEDDIVEIQTAINKAIEDYSKM